MTKSFWIYILASKSNTLYVGVTNNLERRVYEHKNKLIAGFTAKYNVVYLQEFSAALEAIAAEKKLKGWSRKEWH